METIEELDEGIKKLHVSIDKLAIAMIKFPKQFDFLRDQKQHFEEILMKMMIRKERLNDPKFNPNKLRD